MAGYYDGCGASVNLSGLLRKGHWFLSLDGWLDVLSTAAEDLKILVALLYMYGISMSIQSPDY